MEMGDLADIPSSTTSVSFFEIFFVQVLMEVLLSNNQNRSSKNGVISQVLDLALTQLLQSNFERLELIN